MRIVVLIALAGCGRVGFDHEQTGSNERDAAVDATADTAAVIAPCPATTAPDPLTMSGQTFEYSGFNNQTTAVPGVVVDVALADGTFITSTTSDADGMYSVAIPTGGVPRKLRVDYAPIGYWKTSLQPDVAIATNITGPNMTRWRFGDGPVWGDGQMGSVYGSAGLTRDNAKGTLNIAVRTCTDEIVEGVSITVTPTPDYFGYIDAGGFPSTAITSTVAPYTSATAMNAQPGLTRIQATHAGLTFLDVMVDVKPGSNVTYPVLHPLP